MPSVAVAPNALGEGGALNGSPGSHSATDLGVAEARKRGRHRGRRETVVLLKAVPGRRPHGNAAAPPLPWDARRHPTCVPAARTPYARGGKTPDGPN